MIVFIRLLRAVSCSRSASKRETGLPPCRSRDFTQGGKRERRSLGCKIVLPTPTDLVKSQLWDEPGTPPVKAGVEPRRAFVKTRGAEISGSRKRSDRQGGSQF